MDKETNSRAYKAARRQHICTETGKCAICPIHGGENSTVKKRSAKKPRSKGKR